MPTIRVQCTLDEKVWARIDALKVTPRSEAGRRGGSQQARRERDLVALVMRGLEAIEADEATRDTDRSPATPPTSAAPTPRNDIPTWMAQTPSTDDSASRSDAEDTNAPPSGSERRP